MCGRFVQLPLQFAEQCPWPELAGDLMAITAKFNLAPTQRAAVGGVDVNAAANLTDPQRSVHVWKRREVSRPRRR